MPSRDGLSTRYPRLLVADEHEPKQPTQPKGKDARGRPAKPIEIPVPKRADIDRLLKQAAQPLPKPPKT
jgi:hypothetical protein